MNRIKEKGARRMETKCPPAIPIWVDREQKIASFHAVEGQSPLYCHSHEQFLSYTLILVEEGFRFM